MGNYRQASARTYVRYYPKAKIDVTYPDEYTFKRVSSLQELHLILQQFYALPDSKKALAFDTETSSLSVEEGHIVGFSFCFHSHVGYYVPIRHLVEAELNLPAKDSLDQIYLALCEASKALFFNTAFDKRFLRAEGYDVDQIDHFETSVPVWVLDSNIRMPSLKESARWFLGWQMLTYEETTKEANFQEVSPREAYLYAAGDALATYNLMFEVFPRVRKYDFTVNLDNVVIPAVMAMEDNPNKLNLEQLEALKVDIKTEMEAIEKTVFEYTGNVFNIASYDQLRVALESLGLTTYRQTEKTKKMKTNIESLEEIEHLHPVVEKIVRFKKLGKLLSSYITPLIKGFREDLGGVRFNYNLQTVTTGRLSSSGDSKNRYFVKVNVQSTPKPKPMFYSVYKDPDHPDNLLGYVFTPVGDHDDVERFRQTYPNYPIVEGMSPKLNVRHAFVPSEPDHVIVSLDYSGQELRIPANLSKEPIWLNAFLEGKDPHKATAVKMWGEASYNNEMRKKAKTLNFGALYGGSKRTFARTLRCAEYEAQDLLDQWWSTLKTLKNWTDYVKGQGRKYGYTTTVFGRPRRVKHWINSTKFSERGYGERIAVNHRIQGSAGDMMRLALMRIYKKILKKKNYSKVYRLLSSIHDEVNSSIHREWVVELVRVMLKCMDIKVPGWQVPMEVGIEIGHTWGMLFKFEFQNDVLVPVLES